MAQMAPQPNWNEPQKKGRFQQIKEFIRPPPPSKRIEDAYGVMKEVGGFSPLFNIKDLEQRRTEVSSMLQSLTNIEFEIKRARNVTTLKRLQRSASRDAYKLAQLLNMFFTSGSPWVRGLDNRELSSKVRDYLELYNDVGHLPSFLPDIFACSMQLLHLSFQAIDVTNTPGYVIQTTPMIMQTSKGFPKFQSPDGGNGEGGGQSRNIPQQE